jgi:hypothetical protein
LIPVHINQSNIYAEKSLDAGLVLRYKLPWSGWDSWLASFQQSDIFFREGVV